MATIWVNLFMQVQWLDTTGRPTSSRGTLIMVTRMNGHVKARDFAIAHGALPRPAPEPKNLTSP